MDQLNGKIKEFDFGYHEKLTIPTEIKSAHLMSATAKIKETASQMWTLATLLPFMFGSYITDDNPNWKNFIKLLLISSLLTAYNISSSTIEFLNWLIAKYLETYQELYSKNLIPKQQYFLHYPWLTY